MKCPIDDETLVMTERQGVEIDYCPRCRGVWLDRGELDKIIDKAAGAMALPDPDPEPAPPPAAAPRHAAPEPQVWQQPYRQEPQAKDKHYKGRYSRGDDDRYERKRKRKSILSEIFDFD